MPKTTSYCAKITLLLWLVFAAMARAAGSDVVLVLPGSREIVIEEITYGTNHSAGSSFGAIERIVPKSIKSRFPDQWTVSEFTTPFDSLVVWVTGNRGGATGTGFSDIDLAIRGTKQFEWRPSSRETFFLRGTTARQAFVFRAYPRTTRNWDFVFRANQSLWSTNVPIVNTQVVKPAKWNPDRLPYTQDVGDYAIAVSRLNRSSYTHTGGGDPNAHWKPEIYLLQNGTLATGWLKPKWTIRDPMGNSGDGLGLAPVIQIDVSFFASPLNTGSVTMFWELPSFSVESIKKIVWNLEKNIDGGKVRAIMVSDARMNNFVDGRYVPTFSTSLSLISRGTTRWYWASASGVDCFGHLTDQATIYLWTDNAELRDRLGVRLRDSNGKMIEGKREPLGQRGGVVPFLLDLEGKTGEWTPEVVRVGKISAEITLRTPAASLSQRDNSDANNAVQTTGAECRVESRRTVHGGRSCSQTT